MRQIEGKLAESTGYLMENLAQATHVMRTSVAIQLAAHINLFI